MNTQAAPRYNQEAEEGVIACCLNEATSFDSISSLLRPDDFYFPRHQIIFKAIATLSQTGTDFSEIELVELLKKDGTLEEVGGIQAIFSIQRMVETSLQIKSMAKIVKEKSKLRQLIRAGRQAIEDAEADQDPEAIVSSLEASIISMNADQAEDSSISLSAGELGRQVDAMLAGTYVSKGLSFGIPAIDSFIPHGLTPGSLTIGAAPPSSGKSQMALCVHLYHGLNAEKRMPSGYFSYEMPSIDLANRMLRVGSGVNIDKLKDQVATKSEVESVRTTLAKLEDTMILTDHRHNNVNTLSSLARQWKRKHDIKLLTIDYLQLLAPVNSRSSSVESLAHNTATIKQLALDLDIPILLLCQLTYEARRRIIEKPGVGLFDTDLIGGSSTSNDADNILLWWPAGGRPNESREIDGAGKPYMQMRGVFAKARNGVRDEPFGFKFVEQSGRFH